MSRTATVVFAILVSVAACGSDESSDAKPAVAQPVTFANGDRLRAIIHEVDGVKLLVGWQDTRLGKPCAFLEGRCLPGVTRLENAALPTFADDACTARVVRAFGEVDTVALVTETRSCKSVTLHVPGERIMLSRTWMRNAAGACEEAFVFPSDEPGGTAEFVRIGPAMDPASEPFVHATEENGPPAGRIVPRWRVAEDGSKEIVGAWDTERNEIVSVAASGKRWLPRDQAYVVGESTCPGIATSFACKPSAVILGGDGCREPEVFAVGNALEASACPTAAGGVYEVSSKIPPTSFAESTTIEVGSGRVRLAMSAAGDPILPRWLVDSAAGAPCTVIEQGGVLRCVPQRDGRVTDAFADEACTQRAIVFSPNAAACDAAPTVPRFVALVDGSAVEVGSRLAAVWNAGVAGCAPGTVPENAAAYAVTPLQPARLPVIVMRTE